MWNANFIMPTFVMIAIIVVIYLSKRRLPTRRYEVFDAVLATEVATMVMAYATSRMDEVPGAFPDALLWGVNYLFFVLFVLRGYAFFAFACELVGLHDNRRFLIDARSLMIRLQQNNFSSVKIDRDFTWSHFEQLDALLPGIIAMCHDLGIEVIVESVESVEMVEEMRRLGADYLQGYYYYYYSKPIPAEEFRAKYLGAGVGASADAHALAGAR